MADYPVDARRHSFWGKALSLIHDRNPFYPLSALCMFIGFRIILGAINSPVGDWKSLLGLIFTLQIYELVMIGLALFLIMRLGLMRDGWILLGIEALFLVDMTNLNAELFTARPALGSVVNGFCFLLAMGKILFVCRTLKLKLTSGTTFYIAAQMAFLLGLPGMFRLMRSPTGVITPMQIYGVWCMVGLLVAGSGFLVKRHANNDFSTMALLPFRLYIALPLISLLIHLTSENRVYWVHFHHANFGPLLLGILVAVYQRRFIRYSSFILFCMATILLLSIAPEDYQRQLTSRFMGIGISPLRTMLLGSAAVAVLLAIRHRSLLAIMSIAGCGTLATMGTNVHEIGSRAIILFRTLLDWSLQIIHGFTPQTPTQWGVLAILGAFAFLAVGAVISLRTAKKIESESVELEPNDLAT